MLTGELLQKLRYPLPRDTITAQNPWTLPTTLIDDGETAQGPPATYPVVNKVHRPTLLGLHNPDRRSFHPGQAPALALADGQSFFAIHPFYAFMIDSPAAVAQQPVQPGGAVARILSGQLP